MIVGVMLMKVKIEGLNSLSKALTKKKVAVENVKTIVSDAADTGERTMKERVPVDTGRLKDSIERKESDGGKTVKIEPTARDKNGRYYAGYVEFGTKKTPAVPFVRPAQEEARKQLFEDGLKLLQKK